VAEPRGMGRGLGAILPDAPTGQEVVELPVETIRPNPDQPRVSFDEEALSALSESIAASGVIQPLIVRELSDKSYELIAGERRWRAARMAGLDRVPVILRDSDEAARMEVALIENMVREDLNPMEEARACAALVEDLGLSKEALGKRVGRSRPQISNLIRLLDLPDDVQEMIEAGELTEGHGKAILRVQDHSARRALARSVASAGWSVRRTEEEAARIEGGPSRPRTNGATGMAADEQELADRLTERFETGTGHPVKIKRVRDGYRLEITFPDLPDAASLADKLP
jgi:ParB family transcriptional regulator, chromosome partitioning protein